MSLYEEHAPQELPNNEDIHHILDEFHAAKDNLFEASLKYIRRPIQRRAKQLSECGAQLMASLYDFAKYVVEDDMTDIEQKSEILATLYCNDDEERVGFFNGLLGSDKTESFQTFATDKQTLTEVIGLSLSGLGDPEEDNDPEYCIDEFVNDYGISLVADLNCLLELGAESSRARKLQACESLGKHALDVAKVSMGVAIGSMLVKGWEEHRRS